MTDKSPVQPEPNSNSSSGSAAKSVNPVDIDDFDDDSAMPTFHNSNPTESFYARSGRAAPQSIPAVDQNETSSFERPHPGSAGSLDSTSTSAPLASDAPTTVAPAPIVQPTRQLERSEESFDSTDFAATDFASVATPAMVEADPVVPISVPEVRRGTLDFGLLIIRAVVGLYLILSGVFTFFSLGGSTGLNGLESEFAGYQLQTVLSILLPSIELAAGVFLLLGLMTPVAAAVAIVATSFTALHEINLHEGGWGQLSEPIVLAVLLTLIVIGLQFSGPGKISLDSGRGWALRPLASSWIFVVIGIAGAVALWWFGAGVNPF